MLAMCHSDLHARLNLGTSDHASGGESAIVGGEKGMATTYSLPANFTMHHSFQITLSIGKFV